METINWKERAVELYRFCTGVDPAKVDIEAMLELAKEVHDKACEEQKKICTENATVDRRNYSDLLVNKSSVLNSPNAKFE